MKERIFKMTIKELKEKIKSSPNLRRSEIVATIMQLNELNENVDIKVFLQSDILNYHFKDELLNLYMKYGKETFKDNIEKTITGLSKKLPSFVFDYVIMNQNARIKYKYILNNVLKEKSFVLNKEELDNLDYDYIVKQILDDIQK